MSDRVRIVSDGTAIGTQVLNADGVPIPGIARIEILPLDPAGVVIARLTIIMAALDVVAKTATGKLSDEQAQDSAA